MDRARTLKLAKPAHPPVGTTRTGICRAFQKLRNGLSSPHSKGYVCVYVYNVYIYIYIYMWESMVESPFWEITLSSCIWSDRIATGYLYNVQIGFRSRFEHGV